MDSISSPPSANMSDKKAITARFSQLPSSKNGSSSELPSKDYGKKSAPQYVRKRENDRSEFGRKPVAGRGGRSGQRYVRPREKTCGQVELCEGASEVGSLYRAGGKKQNITHLMNWWGPGYRSHHSHGVSGERSGARIRRYSAPSPKYSKEHYLQANCQFVVEEGEDYSVYSVSPDLLVEWKNVEEVRLHMSEAPSCPICLHHPSAAKVTRCGHIYCFPCILHYLALSDEKWRKCPICYAPVEREDLKSVIAIVHKDFGIGEEIELQLMRRERDSLLPVPVNAFSQKDILKIPRISDTSPASTYSKLLLASKEEVKTHVLDREHRDLIAQLVEEGDQPEACFINEALALLQSRRDDANKQLVSRKDGMTSKIVDGMESLSLSGPGEHSCESPSSLKDPTSPVSSDGQMQFLCDPPLAVDQVREPPPPPPAFEDTDASSPTITVDDLDISQLQPANCISQSNQGQRNAPKATFFFYQASNGAQIYLHSINVKMLVHEYGSLENCPSLIIAKVLEKESANMTEDLRNRLRYLRHLPVSCSFDVVEVALGQPLISKLTLSLFQDQIENRQKRRNKRAREERKIAKRVRAEEDRMMGRCKGAIGMKIDSFVQFPSFADDFPSSGLGPAPEGAAAGLYNPSESECSTSPTNESLYGSSADTSGTGVSFARMIREGQTKISHSHSEPKGLGTSNTSWPSLGGTSNVKQGVGVTTVKSNPIQSSWGVKHSVSFSDGMSQQTQRLPQNEDDDTDEEAVAVPEFKRSFSNAIAQALDAAAARNAAVAKSEGNGNVNKKGKKKKQKQVLLFSSGGLN
ncbi:RING finger protein 10 [Halocaridina rubra]|uniref:E3 ubiquitin-protein ligase RNF10 n=1 Tax=Halocaridina rubra TaxID=373956 RepID=A0AAN9AHC5_HALRR